MHLCPQCAGRLSKEYQELFLRPWQMLEGGAPFPLTTTPQKPDEDAEFRHRRKLGELKARLEHAVAGEDYETAAKLKNEIAAEEKNVPGKTPGNL